MKYLVIITLVLLLFLVTNPSKDDHVEKVRISLKTALSRSLAKEMENNFAKGLGAYLGDGIVDALVEKSVNFDNFFLFSRTHFRFLDKDVVVGYGVH
jgi:hypothetical protein